MKIGRAVSIFACLLFSLQICDAVICPGWRDSETHHLDGTEKCNNTCIYVNCGVRNPDHGYEMEEYGCPNKMNYCRLFGRDNILQDEFDFINQHNPNALMFMNNSFIYVSGCGDEKEGYDCIEKKIKDFKEEIKGKEGIYWHSSDDGVKGNGSLGRGNSNGGGGTNNGNTNGNSDGTSASNSQNGAFKFVGIVASVWILVAAWIH